MLDNLDELPIEDRHEIQRAVEEAGAANELLNSTLVMKFFKDEVDSIFNDFLSLKLSCNLEDYREIHMRAYSLDQLRMMLESKKQKGENEADRLKRIFKDEGD